MAIGVAAGTAIGVAAAIVSHSTAIVVFAVVSFAFLLGSGDVANLDDPGNGKDYQLAD